MFKGRWGQARALDAEPRDRDAHGKRQQAGPHPPAPQQRQHEH